MNNELLFDYFSYKTNLWHQASQ